MYTLACKDLGAPDCPYVSSADTAEAAVADMKAHAVEAHPEAIQEMASTMSEDQIMEKMMGAVKME